MKPVSINAGLISYLISRPHAFLVFLYFLTISWDLAQVKLFLFKFKLNNLVGVILFLVSLLVYRQMHFHKSYFFGVLFCFVSIFVSFVFGYNLIACLGFLSFYIFNCLVYFYLPINLFKMFPPEILFRMYFFSFTCMGLYAFAQVLVSFSGFYLPGVHQYINGIARGQGLCYEPSYYALYMTPFTIYFIVVYLLSKNKKGKFFSFVFTNLLLLISTSSGCFFSYVALLLLLFILYLKGIVVFRFRKLIAKITLWSTFFAASIFLFEPDFIKFGLLKFFYDSGFVQHHSIVERWSMIEEYLWVFLYNPWIGTGLGGATAFILSSFSDESINVLESDILNQHIASNVTTEIMASLGILGCAAFVFLIVSFAKILKRSLQIPQLSEEEKIQLIALISSLGVILFTLQFSQSIMRAYIWLHVGMTMGYARYLQEKYQFKQFSEIQQLTF